MPKKIDPKVTEALKKYDLATKDAVWDCRGTWVVRHKVLEQIAAAEGIVFDPPEVLECNNIVWKKTSESKEYQHEEAVYSGKHVAIYVRGFLGDSEAWSIGEAAPNNTKQSYPWAMAEKRAKDRVILKLIGLHGLVYSEEEADDFKEKPKSAAQLKRETGPTGKTKWDELQDEISQCDSPVSLARLKAVWEKDEYPQMTKAWREQADELFEKAEADVTRQALENAPDAPDRGLKAIGDDPTVQEIFKQYPGSKIKEIRLTEDAKKEFCAEQYETIKTIWDAAQLRKWYADGSEQFKAAEVNDDIVAACERQVKEIRKKQATA
jgi:hypothetical protein